MSDHVRVGQITLDETAVLCCAAAIQRASAAWCAEGRSVKGEVRVVFGQILDAAEWLRDHGSDSGSALEQDGTGTGLTEDMLTPREIAAEMELRSASYVRRVCRTGDLSPYTHRVGGRLFVERRPAMDFIDKHHKGTANATPGL